MAAITAAVSVNKLPRFILMLYAFASLVAFAVYAWDKSAARKNQQRTPEASLHLIGLACGWPGALLAQQLLRHKSSKVEFQRVYWITVMINCSALAYLVTSGSTP